MKYPDDSLWSLFSLQLMREWQMNYCNRRMLLNAGLFFLMVMVFFPLTLPADSNLLRTILPGLVWITVLLAMLLSSERLFQQDYDDGVIEQWLVSGHPFSLFVSAKVWMHWFFMMLPIISFCPLLALLFGLNLHEIFMLMISLLSGTPAILFLCALAAAFGTGLKQTSVLMALVLLPLTLPVMIFGSSAILVTMQGQSGSGFLALLLAISLLSACFLPFAIAGIARVCFLD